MKAETPMKKILAILGPELVGAADPLESTLLKRAAGISRETGCQLELFHVAYDSSLEYRLFKSDDELEQQRQQMLDREATRLSEIAAWLVQNGLHVEHDTRWGYPRADVMLKKIAQSKPDFVMKRQEEHGFLLGITTNADWELARRSAANLWLVHDDTDRIDTLVAAIGSRSRDSRQVTSAADRALLETAIRVGKVCGARVLVANAYELPDVANFVASVGGTVMPVQSAQEHEEARSRIVARHRDHVKALTESAGIRDSDIFLREGHPATVIPELAKQAAAGMIVMGAASISRLERVIRPVTVEPVMANADCDILIIREDGAEGMTRADEDPIRGEARYDLEHAITNPEETFDSPQQVARLTDVSVDLRRRILQVWEYDIRAEMAEENEGGTVREIDVNLLDDIHSARALIDMKAGEGSSSGSGQSNPAR